MVLAIACYNPRTRRPTRFLIPEGYVGWVRIDFGIKDTPPLPIEDGFYLIKIPASGRLQTSTEIEYGTAKDENYYYSGDSRRLLKVTGWGSGGMIWGDFTGSDVDSKGAYLYSFVGTEEQFNNRPKEKDENGLHPKVGPIKPLPASNNSLDRSAS